jgi:serine/threonine protein kinase
MEQAGVCDGVITKTMSFEFTLGATMQKALTFIFVNVSRGAPVNIDALKHWIYHEILVWNGVTCPIITLFLETSFDFIRPMIPRHISPYHVPTPRHIKDNPSSEMSKVMANVAAGMEYLHQQPLIHRHILAASLLPTEDRAVHLADFTSSCVSYISTRDLMDIHRPPLHPVLSYRGATLLVLDLAFPIISKATNPVTPFVCNQDVPHDDAPPFMSGIIIIMFVPYVPDLTDRDRFFLFGKRAGTPRDVP